MIKNLLSKVKKEFQGKFRKPKHGFTTQIGYTVVFPSSKLSNTNKQESSAKKKKL